MVLATHVINVTLKSLGEVAKPAPATPAKPNDDSQQVAPSKRTLRRSTSAPLSPLKPRQLNRVATSPNVAAQIKPASPAQSPGCLATVECARAAFACLRAVKGPIQPSQTDFQVETGMSALVGKLLTLGLHEQAIKELRAIKRRFDTAGSTDAAKATKTETNVAELLDFKTPVPPHSLPTITACQVQVLKLVAATKKPAHIEALLPLLKESNPSSPFNFLTTLAKEGGKEAAKSARQMANISQLILSLAPSVSSQEDTAAMEARLSPSPLAAFELQSIAFASQLKWWKLAGHKGDIDNDILSPFSRCVRAVARRSTSDDSLVYKTITSYFEVIIKLAKSHGHKPSSAPTSPIVAIKQVLGTAAHTAKRYNDACELFSEMKTQLEEAGDSSVRYASVCARYLASALKNKTNHCDVEKLTSTVIEGLDGSLSGTAQELNELLDGLALARRSVVGELMNIMEAKTTQPESEKLPEMLKSFILRYPRFVRRWMGNAPGKDASPKHILQFDQRRLLVMKSISQTLDATLMVVKNDIQAGSIDWLHIDEVLQHCASLLNTLSDPTLPPAKMEQLGNYFVKISSLYFSVFIYSKKQQTRTKELNKQMLQSLSRSIDAVKERSSAEREKAQLSTKLEVFADLCKGAGRTEDAVRTLRSICTDMAQDGVMQDVVAALANQSPAVAWGLSMKASLLSRTLRSMAKLDSSWNDWTFFLPEAERAAVLEHLIYLTAAVNAGAAKPLKLHDSNLTALLRIYSLEKYPIRRLRVLLHIFYQNLGEEEVDEVAEQVEAALKQAQGKERSEDKALAGFLPHFQAYNTCVRAMANTECASLDSLNDAVSTWEGMMKSFTSKDDLYKSIDDADEWMSHLQSLIQLAGLRGEDQLQIRLSQLLINASKICSVDDDTDRDAQFMHSIQLATQYMNNGFYAKAAAIIDIMSADMESYEPSALTLLSLHLCRAEYLAGTGDNDEALSLVSKAQNICNESSMTWAPSKTQATLMRAFTHLLKSTVALQAGDLQSALSSSKEGVRMLSYDWSKLESGLSSTNQESSTISDSSIAPEAKTLTVGPRFWSLASPLLRSLLQISNVYAHVGMFQETLHYAESAAKIAENTQSPTFSAQVAAWVGNIYLRAGKFDKASLSFNEATVQLPTRHCSLRVQLAHKLADFYSEVGDNGKALEFYAIAEESCRLINAEEQESSEVVEEKPKPASRTARTTKAKPATTRAPKRVAAAKPKAAPKPAAFLPPKDVYQASLLASVILSQANAFIRQKDWTSAMSMLERVKDLPKLLGSASQEQIITAMSLIGQSMDQIISDPVFSVVQDSTISFPAVARLTEKAIQDLSPCKSPPKRGRAAPGRKATTKVQVCPAFTESLVQAQDLLVEAHATAMTTSDSSMVRRISALLQNTIILLSATNSAKSKALAQSTMGTVAVDLAHNVTWKREQKVLASLNGVEESHRRRSSMGLVADAARFQKSYVETIPKPWSVISVSLSDNRHDLCITKFQAGHSPFILRLPLERANSRDADSEVFNFEHGKEELLEIIKLANETSHSARDFSIKGERNAWWAEREALDNRLKELLVTIENTWLGGFKGIFSQHQYRANLLARFQKSFEQMLDSSLPSRNSTGRGNKSSKATPVTLDPRILELFIGLGDPTDPDCDFDEALNDLLYFVVDILQFHGERNAYDEIDFDAMVVETYDALRGYYGALKSGTGSEREDGAHTILVLDKALHAFPWESLPCMEGLAVSRVPSLACLSRLLRESRSPASKSSAVVDGGPPVPGHYVSTQTPSSGTYMLNPSSDLKNTQSYFQASFAKNLHGWDKIINKEPTEAEFEKALSNSEVLLYFGHGSGAQYIRGKTIRRLGKCKAATFLMGCSSAALNEVGEFESYGPVWNYMMAGCPAVVGTLWDVTDRDIDRFAGRAFEEWGLLKTGTLDKSHSEGDGHRESEGCRMASLPEAVMRSRAVCRFRYLNAAAVVVYGIPVYIEA